jgi:hypothetical protein
VEVLNGFAGSSPQAAATTIEAARKSRRSMEQPSPARAAKSRKPRGIVPARAIRGRSR